MNKRITVALLLGVAIAGLTGCGSYYEQTPTPDLSADVVVGSWVADGPSGEQALLDFQADGTVDVTGLPSDLFPSTDTEPDWDDQVDRTGGTWTIEETNTPGTPWMYVSMDSVDGTTSYSGKVFAEGEGDSMKLYFFIGTDPESLKKFELTRL